MQAWDPESVAIPVITCFDEIANNYPHPTEGAMSFRTNNNQQLIVIWFFQADDSLGAEVCDFISKGILL